MHNLIDLLSTLTYSNVTWFDRITHLLNAANVTVCIYLCAISEIGENSWETNYFLNIFLCVRNIIYVSTILKHNQNTHDRSNYFFNIYSTRDFTRLSFLIQFNAGRPQEFLMKMFKFNCSTNHFRDWIFNNSLNLVSLRSKLIYIYIIIIIVI